MTYYEPIVGPTTIYHPRFWFSKYFGLPPRWAVKLLWKPCYVCSRNNEVVEAHRAFAN